ncbi:MFS transporter [Herpetosiphon giganteus]|uniref:MFS transporter n=1 Tax=Herpetosiphon giganteus TaxID=2029754 RepID=UPI00195EAF32|nr:MFS transporter [Herpetosiphon giganteus]MBM7844375.1 DHA3 family tetracycline resistance protein-like MFS transporter [Herpetosiphon giganteus]
MTSSTSENGLFRPLQQRLFAMLWTGQTISRLGDTMYQVALSLWVLDHTGSAAAMGLVLICSFAPMIVFSLLGGAAVDRFSRGWLMFSSDMLRALIVGGVGILALTNTLQLWHIYAASISFGFFDSFFQPAYSALVPDVVPAESLPGANSLTALSAQMTLILGPLIASLIVGIGGAPTAFLFNSFSFLVSGLCLIPLLSTDASRAKARRSTGILKDVGAGLRTVSMNPWLWMTIILSSMANMLLAAPAQTALPILINKFLLLPSERLGWAHASIALGAVSASIWLSKGNRLRRRGLMGYGALFLASLATLLVGVIGLNVGMFGSTIALAALLGVLVFRGIGIATFGLIWTHTMQEMVEREQLGRVASIDLLGSVALLPIGYGVAGWAADYFGAPAVFATCGIIMLVMTTVFSFHPAVRKLN